MHTSIENTIHRGRYGSSLNEENVAIICCSSRCFKDDLIILNSCFSTHPRRNIYLSIYDTEPQRYIKRHYVTCIIAIKVIFFSIYILIVTKFYPKNRKASATIKVLPPIKMRSFSFADLLAAFIASSTIKYESPINPKHRALSAKAFSFIALGTDAFVK